MKESITIHFARNQIDDLLRLSPSAKLAGDDIQTQAASALDLLLAQTAIARSGRDGLTGAWHRGHLVDGHLLSDALRHFAPIDSMAKPGTFRGFGHPVEFALGAIILDVHRLILVNDNLGWAIADKALVAIARALQSQFPKANVIRIHGDAFEKPGDGQTTQYEIAQSHSALSPACALQRCSSGSFRS